MRVSAQRRGRGGASRPVRAGQNGLLGGEVVFELEEKVPGDGGENGRRTAVGGALQGPIPDRSRA